jgi:uncharacterized protein with von Willebrand factor type A (vWA) domain
MKRNSFRSLDEFRGSDLWARLNNGTPKKNTRVLRSTRLENMIYRDLRAQDESGLDELESLGAEKLDTFPSLIQDTFQSLYSLNPRRNDIGTLTTNARQFNAEIMDSIMASEEYPTLKSLCEGRELPAYDAVSEFTEQMMDKLDELLETAEGDKNALNVLNRLERQQEQLQEQISQAIERQADDDNILAMATKLESKERQIGRLSEMIEQTMRKSADDIQSAVSSALTAATEKAQETADALASWGYDASTPEALAQNKEMLKRVQCSQKLNDIAKYLGRYREILDNARKNSFTYGRGDKYDITLGKDFARAVSSEYAYLAVPEAVPLFIQKVQRKALKQYRRRERISKGYGDIVVCIDESSSMSGDPIAWAKAVALVLMDFAARNGRSCAMVRFASRGSAQVHVFNKDSANEDIFAFAESFLRGGTDFEEPLTRAVELIEHNGFMDADIVFLTDGECAIGEDFSDRFQEKRKQLNFTVKGIVMDAGSPGLTFSLTPFCEKIYRLSEMSCNDVAAGVIMSIV